VANGGKGGVDETAKLGHGCGMARMDAVGRRVRCVIPVPRRANSAVWQGKRLLRVGNRHPHWPICLQLEQNVRDSALPSILLPWSTPGYTRVNA